MRERQFTDCVDIVGSSCKPFEGNRRYISTGAVTTDHIDESDVEIVDYKFRPSRADLVVEPETLLFAKMQGTKKTLYVDKENAENIYSTGFFALKAKSGVISTRCLYHLLGSASFLTQKDKNCSGATQKAITNAGLKKIRVSIPDYQLQEAIADQLDKISSVIQMRRSELQKLDDLVKARFVEMFGDPAQNPIKWVTKPLLEMGYCKNGMNFHSGDSGMEIHCLGVGDFKDYSVIDGTDYLPTISLSEEPSEESLLQDGDIVFVRSNGNKALVGRCLVIYPHNTPTTYSGFCIRYRLTSDDVNTAYLLRVLKADSMRKKMTGRGANIQNLNQQTLATLNIPIPPMELQQQFAAFVKQIDKSKFVESIHVLKLIKEAIAKEVSHDRIR